MSRTGFIGLGRMGLPMASNLNAKGFPVLAYDVSPSAQEACLARGLRWASGVGEVAAGCDAVFTMLPNSAAVLETYLADGGLVAKCAAGATLVDMSTIAPDATDRIARAAAERGLRFVDAAVGRLATHAERGESLFMVGADTADFQRIHPMLQAMGTTIHHCGAVGTGIRTKLVNNCISVASCQLNSEALALAASFGLSLETTLSVIEGTTATNGQLKLAWPGKVLSGDTSPGFAIDLAYKDLTLVLNAAVACRTPMPVSSAAHAAFSLAQARGAGNLDCSAMLDVLCDLAGIERPRLQGAAGNKQVVK